MKKKSLPGFFVVILITQLGVDCFAQDGIIKGQVQDEGIALLAATVSVANKTIVTNSKGEFSVAIIAGTYILSATHAGYNKFEQQIIVKGGETQTVTISLRRAEQLGEVVVLGSRSAIQRSNLSTAVPVDRISSNELKQTNQPSLIQMLNFAAPSFNVSRQHLSEPVTLRGLSPDHLLILLNGSRYHNIAGINAGGIRGTLGPGSVANNLNSIPFSAIEKIEILRDGSSAQYGSDAIAGVMNVELKKTTGKTSINIHTGQHYKGDGENFVFGLNHGFRLNKKGFLNFSGDFLFRNPTQRGGEYQGLVYYPFPKNATGSDSSRIKVLDSARIQQRGFSRQTPVSNDGSIQLTNLGFLTNGGYPINSRVELFWTGAVNYRQPVNLGAYRYPKDSNQVNTLLHPDGFKPKIIIQGWDITGIVGANGQTNKEWNWEWKSVFGEYYSRSYLNNTNNPSQFALGANAATEFYVGSNFFLQQTNTISVAKDFAKEMNGVKTFNIGLGAEYRFEKIGNQQGEEASWENYDRTGRITQGGIMPSPGTHPRDVVNESRRVAGLYVDLETDINDHFLINIAGRFENYSEYGNNVAGKLALRYKVSSAFAMRGSISNGYHAPALQQIHYTSNGSRIRNVGGVNIPVRIGTFRNNSAVTQAFGVKPLEPEKALNISSGLTSTISQHINLTVDAYWIQIKNRIVLSGRFDKSNPDVRRILGNFSDVDEAQFITNAINTRTRGIDIVMNGHWRTRKGSLGFMLAANFTQTNIFGSIQLADSLGNNTRNTNTLFNREEREKLENGQPGSKIILSANYKKGKIGFCLQNTRFGKTSAVFNSTDESLDEFFSAKVLTDLSISYSPKTWLTITSGANNIFDVYPDPLKNYLNTTEGILIYSNEAMSFGYNGGYYFVSMTFNL